VKPLQGFALDESKPTSVRQAAIRCLGAIGPAADESAESLQELAKTNPEDFKQYVDQALRGMGNPGAVKGLLERLKDPDHWAIPALRDIAMLGEQGNSAGQEVLQFMDHEDWELRVAAAVTLGYIRYRPAIKRLEQALDARWDVRLNYVAADALGRIRAPESIPALRTTMESHWYKPVREIAKKAIQNIKDPKPSPVQNKKLTNVAEYFAYEHIGREIPRCGLVDLHQEEIRFKVRNGTLVGTNRGEWGGKLTFIDSNETVHPILEDNICGIFGDSQRVLVIAGLAHLMGNRGIVYELILNDKGSYDAKKLVTLPGAPAGMFRFPHGGIVVDTRGGTLVLSPNGSLRLLDCSDW
jgi:HEAT repeat protein